ncbi:protein-L-isoaspartate(D-aspartate) O-methyltransferase [Vulgatibacter incomptus]|uniref:Protein-L-isoaspartate O-methyltransferase n=1 Tax=Vulgatibacter incomptus TaxID=1391653 RepID=A0A0K1P936_9BACT|nr:protein-L-isoaspartate(D-aspartate) O-methyltransferase [Vulgatibacter incomptus]AKU90035.1 Protein-L-isoaspartate O-methyltransferase [Vulgatibacter incomptus]
MGIESPLVAASRRTGVRDARVLDAIATIEREAFVPTSFRFLAQNDTPIRIPDGQVTTQPSLVARMVEALRLEGDERVLEVGTGLGYQAAVLSRLCAEVVTIERFAGLAEGARRNLRDAGITTVTVIHGDGTLGHPPLAPYDAIVVAAASPDVSPPLVEQLAEGGILVQPMGPGGAEVVTVFHKRGGALDSGSELVGARFVSLVSGPGEERAPT